LAQPEQADINFIAFGLARVPAVVAGAFINIEPLVGAAAAALFFGETITVAQVGAGLAILTGVALSRLAAAESGAGPVDPGSSTTSRPTCSCSTAPPSTSLRHPDRGPLATIRMTQPRTSQS
jgi:EamA-like transporter family